VVAAFTDFASGDNMLIQWTAKDGTQGFTDFAVTSSKTIANLVTSINAIAAFDVTASWTSGTGLIVAYYVVMAFVLIIMRNHLAGVKTGTEKIKAFISDSPLKWLIFPGALVLVVLATAVTSIPDDRLHVYFLDVGQGDAILLQQGTHQVLVDDPARPQVGVAHLGVAHLPLRQADREAAGLHGGWWELPRQASMLGVPAMAMVVAITPVLKTLALASPAPA
jgi:hypothetical protein